MRSYKVEGVVIKKRNFLEKDRILTIFSSEKGKIEILSKGCRRPGSKLSYCSDLGIIGKFYLHQGKSLDILTEFKPIFFPRSISGHYKKTRFIGSIFAIVNKLFELDSPHRETYKTLLELVENIGYVPIELAEVVFLSRVMSDLGFHPNLTQCAKCNKKFSEGEEFIYNEEGEICHKVCSEIQHRISTNCLKFLKLIFTHQFEFIQRVKTEKNLMAETREYLEVLFVWHFGRIVNNKILFSMKGDE